jgi:hypothetical protein
MATDIPEWAWDEVDRRTNAIDGLRAAPGSMLQAMYLDRLRALAVSLIAQHERPPVDPLAEAIQAVWNYAGGCEHMPPLRAKQLRAELSRRGIELGKSGEAS